MKLYVCWSTRNHIGGHACSTAYEALKAAGHDPEIVKARAWGIFPEFMQTSARKRVNAETGSYFVPALERDDGGWVSGSEEILAWAEANPA
jgi:hypothetical protein